MPKLWRPSPVLQRSRPQDGWAYLEQDRLQRDQGVYKGYFEDYEKGCYKAYYKSYHKGYY